MLPPKDVAKELRRLERADELPTLAGKLLRQKIGRVLGLPRDVLTPSCRVGSYELHCKAVDKFEQEWLGRRTRHLKKELHRLLSKGEVPLRRGGIQRAFLFSHFKLAAKEILPESKPFGPIVQAFDEMVRAGQRETVAAENVRQQLRELDAKGTLPTRGGRILRQPTAEMFGLPCYAFMVSAPGDRYASHRAQFELYETEWMGRRVPALEAKLHALYESGELPIYRGVLQRVKLESLLDLPSNSLGPNAVPFGPVVVRFNSFLRARGHGLVWEEKVPQIRLWLEKRVADGTVPRNHWGLLNRSAVIVAFGGSPTTTAQTVRRSPRLAELFAEFDTRLEADQELYRYSNSRHVQRAKELLDGDHIELTNGWVVSTKDLASKLGIEPGDITRTPALNKLVATKQEEINQRIRKGTTTGTFKIAGVEVDNRGATPFSEKHGRVFSFIEFEAKFSLKFCEFIGTAFHQIAQSYVTPANPYYGLLNFLRWISAKSTVYPSIVASMASVAHIDEQEFERAFLQYRADCIQLKLDAKNNGRKQPAIFTNFGIIVTLGEVDVFPKIGHIPKKGRLKTRGEVEHRSSLAEAQREENAVTGILVDSARSRGLDFGRGKDAREFSDTILMERRSRTDLPADLAEAILVITEERLRFVREAASAVFREERKRLEHGDRLVSSAKMSGAELAKRLNYEGGRSCERRVAVDELFPVRDPGTAQMNLAALICDRHGRVCPKSTADLGFFARQYLKIGGAQRLQPMLLPSARMVAAAITLHLAESGANVSVGLTLTRFPFETSSARGFRRVVGYKGRADKPIVDDLAEADPNGLVTAVEAIEFLSGATASIPDGNVLATFAHRGTVRAMNSNAYRREFKGIVASHPRLANLKLVPSMLRPTKLLEIQLKNPRDLAIAKQVAHHEQEATLLGYVGKLPYKAIIEDHMRRFCDSVQVLIADPIRRVNETLGVGESQWKTMTEVARKTGMGVYCSNPLDSPQPDVKKGEKCLALDRCSSCQRRVVIADPESIADMLIWRESLQRSEPLWIEMRLERWENVWLPWLAFFQVVLEEKMTRGPFALVKQRALSVVEKRKGMVGFRLPEVW